mmetsp:Transcript_131775/g.381099  ORF Transcript_131775/g.381099 Transcript_131775/m.381099 type:complete len:579 (-) Transcript_131775:28-1764(-)
MISAWRRKRRRLEFRTKVPAARTRPLRGGGRSVCGHAHLLGGALERGEVLELRRSHWPVSHGSGASEPRGPRCVSALWEILPRKHHLGILQSPRLRRSFLGRDVRNVLAAGLLQVGGVGLDVLPVIVVAPPALGQPGARRGVHLPGEVELDVLRLEVGRALGSGLGENLHRPRQFVERATLALRLVREEGVHLLQRVHRCIDDTPGGPRGARQRTSRPQVTENVDGLLHDPLGEGQLLRAAGEQLFLLREAAGHVLRSSRDGGGGATEHGQIPGDLCLHLGALVHLLPKLCSNVLCQMQREFRPQALLGAPSVVILLGRPLHLRQQLAHCGAGALLILDHRACLSRNFHLLRARLALRPLLACTLAGQDCVQAVVGVLSLRLRLLVLPWLRSEHVLNSLLWRLVAVIGATPRGVPAHLGKLREADLCGVRRNLLQRRLRGGDVVLLVGQGCRPRGGPSGALGATVPDRCEEAAGARDGADASLKASGRLGLALPELRDGWNQDLERAAHGREHHLLVGPDRGDEAGVAVRRGQSHEKGGERGVRAAQAGPRPLRQRDAGAHLLDAALAPLQVGLLLLQ